MAELIPQPRFRALDASGDPLNGGKVYFYEAGTVTPKDTYTDSTMATPNANPVVLDSEGYADIWGDGTYKIVLTDSGDVEISTTDNVTVGTSAATSIAIDDTVTSGVSSPLELVHTTTGTPANGIGTGLEFITETSADNNEIGAIIEAVTTDVTSTSEDFDLVFKLMTAGAAAAELMRLTSTGGLHAQRDVVTDADGRTFALTDANLFLRYTGSGHTWTIPTNTSVAFPTSTEIEVFNAGTGDITLTADTGVTVNGVTAGSIAIPPYSAGFLKKNATNNWDYIGVNANAWA